MCNKKTEYLETKRINTCSFRSHYIPFAKNDCFGFKNGQPDKKNNYYL